MIVATVTDDVRLYEVPKLRVVAMRFTETARARIVKVSKKIRNLMFALIVWMNLMLCTVNHIHSIGEECWRQAAAMLLQQHFMAATYGAGSCTRQL